MTDYQFELMSKMVSAMKSRESNKHHLYITYILGLTAIIISLIKLIYV
jgi:hypothetical protein